MHPYLQPDLQSLTILYLALSLTECNPINYIYPSLMIDLSVHIRQRQNLAKKEGKSIEENNFNKIWSTDCESKCHDCKLSYFSWPGLKMAKNLFKKSSLQTKPILTNGLASPNDDRQLEVGFQNLRQLEDVSKKLYKEVCLDKLSIFLTRLIFECFWSCLGSKIWRQCHWTTPSWTENSLRFEQFSA